MSSGSGDGARHLSPLEAVVLASAATFAAGVFVAPRLLVAIAGRSGALAVVLSGTVIIAWTYALSHLSSTLPDRALAREMVQRFRVTGRAWLGFAALFEILLATAAVREYILLSRTIVVPMMSPLAVDILLGIAAWTGARHRLEGLSRVVLIYFGAGVAIAGAAFLLLLLRADELWAVLPGPHLSLAPIAQAAFETGFLFSGLSAAAFFLPYQTERPRGLPHLAQGALLSAVLFLLAYAFSVATAGPLYTLSQVWPLVSALRTLELRSFVLNRFGLIVVIVWSAIVLSFVAVHLWAAAESVCRMTGSDSRRALFALCASALMVVGAHLGNSVPQQEMLARWVLSPVTVVVLSGWLLWAVWLRHSARKRVGGTPAGEQAAP